VHNGFGVWRAARRFNAGRFLWPSTTNATRLLSLTPARIVISCSSGCNAGRQLAGQRGPIVLSLMQHDLLRTDAEKFLLLPALNLVDSLCTHRAGLHRGGLAAGDIVKPAKHRGGLRDALQLRRMPRRSAHAQNPKALRTPHSSPLQADGVT